MYSHGFRNLASLVGSAALLATCTFAVRADEIEVGPDINDPYVELEGQSDEIQDSNSDFDDVSDSGSDDADSDSGPAMEYQWLPACGVNRPGEQLVTCPGMYTCASDRETKWTLWARQLPDGDWYPAGTSCYSGTPPTTGGGGGIVRPQVTDAMVEREVKRIGLPSASITVQPPGGATLINFDTIFHTEEPEFARTVGLLGYSVDIEATPTRYLWHHGDGTSQTSDGPGAAYPAKTIVHQYTDAHVTVRPSVDVTYKVRWRVGNADWHALDDTLTAAGDSVPLEVKEATALLTDPYS